MKKTILLAEDDKKIANALTRRLQSAGYNVLTVPDGFRSFMAAAGRKPDLILMDIYMPFGDGLTVAEELDKAQLGHIPIIFMTASRKDDFWKRAQELGAVGLFRKPLDSQRLIETISRTLGRKQNAQADALDAEAEAESP